MSPRQKSFLQLSVAIIASLYFFYYAYTPMEWHFIDGVNLLIHEAGHYVFLFFGEFMHILGGSLLQVLFPCVFVIHFYREHDYFSASLLLFWVGQNLITVSVYASDSIVMQLPLLGGDGTLHDWNALLNMTGLLRYTYSIGHGIYVAGVLVIMIAAYFSITTAFSSKKV